MYIERDKEYNLLYISLRDSLTEGIVARTKEFLPGAYYDLDSDGKLLGIEIVNTEYVLGFPVTELHLSGELLGVKEAAELAGKDRANFLRDLASRPDFPAPVARVASGQLWLSKDVQRYLRDHTSDPTSIVEPAEDEDAVEWVEDDPEKAFDQLWNREDRYQDYEYKDYDQYEDRDKIEIPKESVTDQEELEVRVLGQEQSQERKIA